MLLLCLAWLIVLSVGTVALICVPSCSSYFCMVLLYDQLGFEKIITKEERKSTWSTPVFRLSLKSHKIRNSYQGIHCGQEFETKISFEKSFYVCNSNSKDTDRWVLHQWDLQQTMKKWSICGKKIPCKVQIWIPPMFLSPDKDFFPSENGKQGLRHSTVNACAVLCVIIRSLHLFYV